MLAFFFGSKKSGNFIQLNYFKYMKLGFIGTGEITKAVILGITKSKIKYKKILISKRKIKVVHQEKNKERLTWECNPYWTKVHLDINNPRLKNYLTLAGKGKHIELGAFLSPHERLELRDKIQNALAKANSA